MQGPFYGLEFCEYCLGHSIDIALLGAIGKDRTAAMFDVGRGKAKDEIHRTYGTCLQIGQHAVESSPGLAPG